jgi:hypothetical protein
MKGPNKGRVVGTGGLAVCTFRGALDGASESRRRTVLDKPRTDGCGWGCVAGHLAQLQQDPWLLAEKREYMCLPLTATRRRPIHACVHRVVSPGPQQPLARRAAVSVLSPLVTVALGGKVRRQAAGLVWGHRSILCIQQHFTTKL